MTTAAEVDPTLMADHFVRRTAVPRSVQKERRGWGLQSARYSYTIYIHQAFEGMEWVWKPHEQGRGVQPMGDFEQMKQPL